MSEMPEIADFALIGPKTVRPVAPGTESGVDKRLRLLFGIGSLRTGRAISKGCVNCK